MKTIPLSSMTPDDRVNCIATSINGDQITLYYRGDTVPKTPEPTPQEIAAVEALKAKDEADAEAARQYAKLRNLIAMSPSQVTAWVAANVTNITQAQDAIATLAVAVSVLARRI